MKGGNFKEPLLQYGELALAKRNRQEENKSQSDWIVGHWVGRAMLTGEHLLLTEAGPIKVRTIMRRVPELQYETKLIEKVRATPWRPRRDEAESVAVERQ